MPRSKSVLRASTTKERVKRDVRRSAAPTTREKAAYHEAGHVVVGVLLRWAIREVSIARRGTLLGQVRHPRTLTDYWSAEEIASHACSLPSAAAPRSENA